jgi:hypothetical protein
MSWVFFRTSFKQVSINTLNLFDYLDLHYCEKIYLKALSDAEDFGTLEGI